MAINSANQYKYTGKGSLDSKALVKTFDDLTTKSTWSVTNSSGKEILTAYNGMITAVWLDKDENKQLTDKNGVYFLFDRSVLGTLSDPDVTNEANWFKIASLSDLTNLSEQISSINTELTGVAARLEALELNEVILRRDNDYNYKPKENTLIPSANEICFVDVAGYGLRVKIGDGKSTFAELSYIDEPILKRIDNLVVKGYLYDGAFYTDAAHTEVLDATTGRIYIDTTRSKLYMYNGIDYVAHTADLPNASDKISGAVKLYDCVGENTDGTMTQRAITDELNDKLELDFAREEEMIIFSTGIN